MSFISTKEGKPKTALVVSPTHAEAARVTDAVRAALKADGTLTGERTVTSFVAAHLTDAQKADATEYEPGDVIQFHQNARGHVKGSRLVVGDETAPPTDLAARFEVYRAKPLALAVGDRIRVTVGAKTKDGKHRLSNGSLFTVEGFTAKGDIRVNDGWVIDKDFGHLTHGYVTTSHASQGATVHKVFVAASAESLRATDQRTAYVAVTRGKEQAVIFTDDREELLKAATRTDTSLSATELVDPKPAQPTALPKRRRAFQHGPTVPDFAPMAAKQVEAARGDDHAR